MYVHRRSSGAKGNHLAETAGVWESAAIRQTSLAPADYLKARPPPWPPPFAFAADNLIPQKRRKNYKVGGGEKRKRQGRGQEKEKTSFLVPPNLVRRATHPPLFRNLHALYLDLSSQPLVFPLSAHFVPILRPFCLPSSSHCVLLPFLSLSPRCFFLF